MADKKETETKEVKEVKDLKDLGEAVKSEALVVEEKTETTIAAGSIITDINWQLL